MISNPNTFNISDEEIEIIRQFRKSPYKESILTLLGLEKKKNEHKDNIIYLGKMVIDNM